jgi:hypothetical protein
MTHSSQSLKRSSESTPPPEVVQLLRNSAPKGIRDCGVTREIWLINHAYAAGADQQDLVNEAALQRARDEELEACEKYLMTHGISPEGVAGMRSARRPKPISLKERIAAAIADGDERTALSLLNEAMPND